MLLAFLAYVGGVLTIVSPCILPVLPFVFARSDQPFRKSGLPLLAGMAITFALIASLATVGGGWVVRANQIGRTAALVVFGIFGLTLLFSSLAEWLSRPLVRFGGRLTHGSGNSFLLGIGTGLLWAPCAGPILGLILTGAALSGVGANSAVLLLAYAAGAASSLAVALLAGGRVFAAMKRSLGVEEWIRRALGIAVLAAVVAIALGLDQGVLTRLSLASTSGVEQKLVDRFHPAATRKSIVPGDPTELGSGSSITSLPDLAGATTWINSAPLTPAALRGKVVLIDLWTYSCINCLRTLPYVKAWHEKYKDHGLVIIGIHTPEFPFEKDEGNVRKAIRDLGVSYPVAMDNNYGIWRSFHNQYWPTHYFIDATGRIRFNHSGEGGYEESEKWIRGLLEEANGSTLPGAETKVVAEGSQAIPDAAQIQSYETYVGYEKADSFVSPGNLLHDKPKNYQTPATLELNEWAFGGKWNDGHQFATVLAPGASISYRFHSRDLHLVVGPSPDGKPVRFRVTLDGKAPGADHGVDIDADGYGEVTENRLYQLIRQSTGVVRDRTFRIEFLSPGAIAYSFTFG